MGLLRGLTHHPIETGPASVLARRVAQRQVLVWLDQVQERGGPGEAARRLTVLHDEDLLRDTDFFSRLGLLGP
jgi:hypothetical protein